MKFDGDSTDEHSWETDVSKPAHGAVHSPKQCCLTQKFRLARPILPSLQVLRAMEACTRGGHGQDGLDSDGHDITRQLLPSSGREREPGWSARDGDGDRARESTHKARRAEMKNRRHDEMRTVAHNHVMFAYIKAGR